MNDYWSFKKVVGDDFKSASIEPKIRMLPAIPGSEQDQPGSCDGSHDLFLGRNHFTSF